MTSMIRVGERVKHYKHGRGIVEKLLSKGLADVRFGKSLQYVELKNLRSIDKTTKKQIKKTEKEKLTSIKSLSSQITSLLDEGNYKKADILYNTYCADWWSYENYQAEVLSTKKEKKRKAAQEEIRKLALARSKLRSQVITLLDDGSYDKADQLYRTHCADWWKDSEYQTEVVKAQFIPRFVDTYHNGSLADLDSMYQKCASQIELSVDEFVTLKLPKVRVHLEAIGIQLDEEQEKANARPEPRLLVKARAGSGKTRTLCARAALAIRDEELTANQVMILAFNKTAATEIKQRVQKVEGIHDYNNARTFHSLAYQLVQPKKTLLFDAGGHPSECEQSRFAQRMMQRILNPAFKETMMEFFRKELEEVESIGRDLLPDEYLQFRRTLELMTLRGERVKSNGEKFIADFLFEHGIEYKYERAWVWRSNFLDGLTYKPDFSILANGKDYILEHWAFDPEDFNSSVPEHWDTSTEQYRQQVFAKRKFWRSKNISLLETHTGLIKNGREAFENQLHKILLNADIQHQRSSQEDITRHVFENDLTISRMAGLFLQFIQRAKKRNWSSEIIAQRITDTPDKEPRTQLFHKLALRAYREYEAMLEEQNAMDFDDLLIEATEKIETSKVAVNIHLGQGQMQSISDFKWILLDEYQDFSELYYKMLDAILTANPSIRLVAVGDDWQAINAFAGAELRFFDKFSQYFPNTAIAGVTTNYRSDRAVVAAGNHLMRGRGSPAQIKSKSRGLLEIKKLDEVWIEFRQGVAFQQTREKDTLYLSQRPNGRNPSEAALRQAQALKICAQIISEDPEQKTMLLARTGKAYGLSLENFRGRLVEILSSLTTVEPDSLKDKITAMTAHRSKGQEAHRVIILDTTKRQFPKIHPDNLLFELFGVTPLSVLEEERRLFYVAITRAEHCLYILTEKGVESPYLDKINNNPTYYGAMVDRQIKTPPLGKFAGEIQKKL